MALIVSHDKSDQPHSKVSATFASSEESVTPLISRLSVFTVTRKRSLQEQADRVLGDRGDDPGVDVRRRAELEWDATVPHVARQSPELGHTIGFHRDVVDDADPVAEALGVAVLQRLPDRRQPERLAGVQGGVEVLALDELERVEVPSRRVAGLRAGDVEPAHPDVAVVHGELGDLERAGRGAHRREQRPDDDRPPGGGGRGHSDVETGEHRLHHLVELEPRLGVEFGGETHLGVDDAVEGEVFNALEGDALECLFVLHHADGVGEALEVSLTRSRRGVSETKYRPSSAGSVVGRPR